MSGRTLKVVLWPIDKVTPYDGNPRLNDQAVQAVASSIEQFGFLQPIVVDRAGVIVVGDTRYKAAKHLGLAKVPVHVAADLTDEQARAYRIADNRTGEIADWDFGKLQIEIDALREVEFDLASIGFDQDALAEMLGEQLAAGKCDPDEIPEPPAKATTRPGDIWLLGDHRLMCGDSGSPSDLDRLLDGAAIHLLNMDPPYNVKVEPRSGNAIAAAGTKGTHHQRLDAKRGKAAKPTGKMRAKDRPLLNDFVTEEQFDTLLLDWFGNAARVMKPGSSFYIWGGYANCANYPPAMKACKLYFSQAIIWQKMHPVLTRKDFMGDHEWCFYGWLLGKPHRFFGPANVPDVWELSREKTADTAIGRGVRIEHADGCRVDVLPPESSRDRLRVVQVDDVVTLHGDAAATDVWRVRKVPGQSMVHLTEKPVELAVRAMQYSSRKGESVLDLFGGSGSTMIGAEQCGRRAYLMELDPLYCDVIVERYQRFTGGKAKRLKR